jgi:ferredoxin-NADP reductase
VPILKLKLLDRREVARGTWLFVFEKPAGFNYKAGQYGGYTLLDPPETDAGGITRRFSFLSSPHDSYLSIATRIQQSAYKRVLKALPIGSEIKFAGPTGNFILHEDTSVPAVMIAGGIGIAPFYSMIQTAAQQQSTQDLYLFYGNQHRIDAAFFDELERLAHANPHFKYIPTLGVPDSDWQGETGFVTESMIRKYIPDFAAPIYYVCGSPVMVTAIQEMLAETGLDEERIKTEDFPGY